MIRDVEKSSVCRVRIIRIKVGQSRSYVRNENSMDTREQNWFAELRFKAKKSTRQRTISGRNLLSHETDRSQCSKSSTGYPSPDLDTFQTRKADSAA